METIRISVRNLVEFILRSGDIDNRKGGIADKEAMQLGSRLHRKIQGQMGADYRAEVPLKYMETFPLSGKENMPEDSETGSYEISVEGRWRFTWLRRNAMPVSMQCRRSFQRLGSR